MGIKPRYGLDTNFWDLAFSRLGFGDYGLGVLFDKNMRRLGFALQGLGFDN